MCFVGTEKSYCSQNNNVAYARKFGTTKMVETGARFGFTLNVTSHATTWSEMQIYIFWLLPAKIQGGVFSVVVHVLSAVEHQHVNLCAGPPPPPVRPPGQSRCRRRSGRPRAPRSRAPVAACIGHPYDVPPLPPARRSARPRAG